MNRCLSSALAALLAGTITVAAQSDIDPDHRYAWCENVGWTNWQHDAPNPGDGVLVNETFLAGFIWTENIGWISVGDATPADGIHYANTSGANFGINIQPETRDLFGLAWAENVGWINFDTALLGDDRARFDASQHRFFGFVWAENVGWINLNDLTHFVAVGSPPTCNAGGPYVGECEGGLSTIPLDGTGSGDPDDDSLGFEWTTDCPGGVFDDPTSPTPMLTVDTSGGCDNACGVTLIVDDGNGATSECSTSVTISDTQPPVVTCSASRVVGHRVMIEYDVADDCGEVAGSAVIETACCPLPVADGQIMAVRCKEHQECKIMLDFKRDMFMILWIRAEIT